MMTRRAVLAGTVAAAPAWAQAGALPPAMRVAPDREAIMAVPVRRACVRIKCNLNGSRPPVMRIHGGPGSSRWYFLNAKAMAGERAVQNMSFDEPIDPTAAEGPALRVQVSTLRLGVLRHRYAGPHATLLLHRGTLDLS